MFGLDLFIVVTSELFQNPTTPFVVYLGDTDIYSSFGNKVIVHLRRAVDGVAKWTYR